MKLVVAVIFLIIAEGMAAGVSTPPPPHVTPPKLVEEVKSVWQLNLDGFSLDPNKWSDAMTMRMVMVGVVTCAAIYFSYKMAYAVGIGVVAYGMVKLSWPLTASLCALIYGWKFNKKVFLGVGLVTSYALCFGVKLI
uniref:Uncharacterized protein n=1 Tax=Soybean thrips virus 2 TaxID=2796561 RepID=A0A7T3R0L3_9FLAV|nr:hypothetical protein [Soybean thrips virus 2]